DVRGERAAEPKRPSCVVWSLLSPWSGSCPTSAADYELPDLPTLRASSPFVPAPPTFTRWSGFYAGGQVGYRGAHVAVSRSPQQLLQSVLRELALESEQHVSLWKVLGPVDKSGASFGGFVGYNSQWDDIILGVDLTYSKTSFKAVSPVIADQSPHDSGRQRLRRDGLWFREHENPRLGLGALSRRLGRRQLDALCDSRTRVRPARHHALGNRDRRRESTGSSADLRNRRHSPDLRPVHVHQGRGEAECMALRLDGRRRPGLPGAAQRVSARRVRICELRRRRRHQGQHQHGTGRRGLQFLTPLAEAHRRGSCPIFLGLHCRPFMRRLPST